MPELVYNEEVIVPRAHHPNWGAIWVGMFTFLAIWSVFGVLGMAIFAPGGNPNGTQPVTGMSMGMAIWATILTIIAMYFAGLVTGKLAEVGNPRDGVIHGMAMFGLSVVAVLLLLAVGAGVMVSGAATATATSITSHSSYILNTFASISWTGFVALILGWFAAMGGASTGMKRRAAEIHEHQMPHAA